MELKQNFNSLEVDEAVNYVDNRIDNEKALDALVLGTGLGNSIESFSIIGEIPYQDIPFAPMSTVQSHTGKIILANNGKKNIWILSGRMHMYEGYSASQSTFLIHVLAGLGVKNLFITNAVGGVNPHYQEGEIVLINDHINFFPDHPLRGINEESRGPRFPDMSVPYSEVLSKKVMDATKKLSIPIKQGVYFGWPGPSLETPAEYKMINIIGADVVGMSSIPEVIVGKYYDMDVCMLSVVSNVCYPKDRIKFTTLDSVIKIMNAKAQDLGKILYEALAL